MADYMFVIMNEGRFQNVTEVNSFINTIARDIKIKKGYDNLEIVRYIKKYYNITIKKNRKRKKDIKYDFY